MRLTICDTFCDGLSSGTINLDAAESYLFLLAWCHFRGNYICSWLTSHSSSLIHKSWELHVALSFEYLGPGKLCWSKSNCIGQTSISQKASYCVLPVCLDLWNSSPLAWCIIRFRTLCYHCKTPSRIYLQNILKDTVNQFRKKCTY
jgi:hypothetical protein